MLEVICVILLIGVFTLGFLYLREKKEVDFWRRDYIDKFFKNHTLEEELKKRQELRRKRMEKFTYGKNPNQSRLK